MSRFKRAILSSSALVPVLAISSLGLTMGSAQAACDSGPVITCTIAAPNPWTATVGGGATAAGDGQIITLQPGASIEVGNTNAISARDNVTVTVGSGSVVSAIGNSPHGGGYAHGMNTIEVRANSVVIVEQGARVSALGLADDAEAINPQGAGNLIINRGTIEAFNASSLYFENTTGLNTIINTATGVISRPGGFVLGHAGDGAIDFTNMGQVQGRLTFSGGDDILRLFPGQVITNGFNAGTGNDTVYLSGTGAAAIDGQFTGFETLIKDGLSTWTITGTITDVTAARVDAGTLILTGDNSAYAGTFTVNPAGTLQGRAQSLPGAITDDGLVRFAQPDAGTYTGLISGSGAVEKTGAGVLTLAPTAPGGNTYAGGTTITEGTLAVAADNALGAPAGGLTLNGGSLQYAAQFTLSGSRPVTITAATGTIDTQGFSPEITRGISGPGGLVKVGGGTLILSGNSSYAGGTAILAGTLQLGSGGATGAIIGNVANGGVLAFNRSDVSIFSGEISGTGAVTQIGSGTTTLTAANTYAGGTTIAAGTLQLGNGGTSGSILGNVANNGILAFNRSDVITFAGVISGSGGVAQFGPGTTVLSAVNTYAGPTQVAAGTLALPAGAALSGGGAASVAAGATLGGYGSIAGGVNNLGTIRVADALAVFTGGGGGSFIIGGTLVNSGLAQVGGAGVGNVLQVGSYVGQGGRLGLNTVLAGDNAPSDRLVINGGSASGQTSVLINNVGGAGAATPGNGILVISAINGASTAAGAFSLSGPVVAGPYEYTLFRGSRDASDQNSWYLRSELPVQPVAPVIPVTPIAPVTPVDPPVAPQPSLPNYRPETSLYAALPSLALGYGQAMLGTLHERVGEQEQLRGMYPPGSSPYVNGAWGRLIGVHGDRDGKPGGIYGGGPAYDYSYVAFQAGLDIIRKEYADGSRDHLGIYVGVGRADSDVTHFTGARAGSNSFDAQTLGAYWTHYGAGGWYVDAVGQVTWYDAKANSGRLFALKTNGFGAAASLEGGYRFLLGGGWAVEPQVQLVYQRINLDGGSDGVSQVRFRDVESLAGRVGARLLKSWSLDGGATPRQITAWARVNLWNEFLGVPKTDFLLDSGFVPFRSDTKGPWADLSVGLTAQLTQVASLYGNVSYQVGLDGRSSAYSGRAGLRINW